MSRQYTSHWYVDTTVEQEIKPVKGKEGRDYLLIQNFSANDIYINFGTHADANNGITVAAGLYYERERSVPDDYIYIRGSLAAGGLQRVQVSESYAK